jgi:hypothetical protein
MKGTATMSSTASENTEKIPGWYIEFLAALLRQAPRPGDIDQVIAEGWTNNQGGLKKNLASCLLPPPVVVSVESSAPELLLELVSTVEGPHRWGGGRQVFSRLSVPLSVLESSETSAPA